MTEKKAFELSKIIRAAIEQQENTIEQQKKTHAAVTYVMQSIAQEINRAINPVTEMLVPFIIAALELMARSMRANYPKEANEAADEVKQAISDTCIKIRTSDIVTPPGGKKS